MNLSKIKRHLELPRHLLLLNLKPGDEFTMSHTPKKTHPRYKLIAVRAPEYTLTTSREELSAMITNNIYTLERLDHPGTFDISLDARRECTRTHAGRRPKDTK